jgi:hypothetical protein
MFTDFRNFVRKGNHANPAPSEKEWDEIQSLHPKVLLCIMPMASGMSLTDKIAVCELLTDICWNPWISCVRLLWMKNAGYGGKASFMKQKLPSWIRSILYG